VSQRFLHAPNVQDTLIHLL